jgi:hypothetical protein
MGSSEMEMANIQRIFVAMEELYETLAMIDASVCCPFKAGL